MITWTPTITVLDIASKYGRVTCVRHDDVTLETRTYSVESVISAVPSENIHIMNMIWGQYQDDLAKEASQLAVIGTLIAAATTNLEGREP